MVWRLQGTERQNEIVEETLEHVMFPFDDLLPGLRQKVRRDYIPVEWADLSRYTDLFEEAKNSGEHLHFHDEDGTTAHPVTRPVEGREQVLGLAWYSGRVTLDQTMERNPMLAGEVFLSEGAHMIDFFFMEDTHRAAIWNAVHADHHDIAEDTPVADGKDLGHGHSWFDVGGYYSWVGEAWMGLFVQAYSDLDVTIEFEHPPTEQAVKETRAALTPYCGITDSVVYHDSHRSINMAHFWTRPPEGRRACLVCDPK